MKEIIESREIFLRFRQGARAKSVADLAQVIGVAPQSIYNAQATGKIPGSWFRKVADLNNISIDWLTYGEGSMYRGETMQKLSPPYESIGREILLEVVETLEGFLQDAKKTLPPKAKAELVCQLYQLVTEETGTGSQPLRMFRLIQAAIVANE